MIAQEYNRTFDLKEAVIIDAEMDRVRQAQAGNSGAFADLCKENSCRLYALCLRMLADKELAKELVQDAIVRAWQMIGTYRGESPFSAWIHRIAVNAVLDHFRAKRRLSLRVEFTDDLESLERNDHFPETETTIDLEDAIAALPAQARSVLILHDIEGYRHEEIAAMMDIAPGTSKAHLHRARALLKEMLQR